MPILLSRRVLPGAGTELALDPQQLLQQPPAAIGDFRHGTIENFLI